MNGKRAFACGFTKSLKIMFGFFFLYFFSPRDDRTTVAAATSARLSWTPARAARSPPPPSPPLPPTSRLGRGPNSRRQFARSSPVVLDAFRPSSFVRSFLRRRRRRLHIVPVQNSTTTYIYCFSLLVFFADTSSETSDSVKNFYVQTFSGNVRGHARAATKIAVPPSPLLGKHVHDSSDRPCLSCLATRRMGETYRIGQRRPPQRRWDYTSPSPKRVFTTFVNFTRSLFSPD